jgi:flavorubredoxin
MKEITDNKVLEVTPDVHWVGVLDRDIVTFDVVMETEYGTTYNSYLINADKKAIIETTKYKFWDEYKAKIESLIDSSEIEYIIMNHTEPDHSGNLMRLMELAPNATVVGSGNALRYLNDIFEPGFKQLMKRDGDTLDLGNKTLKFIGAPNLHWPDTIYTYLEEDQVLFTCDSFGAHFCHEEMFDDKVGEFGDAFKYYFDVILKPFSKFMLKAIDKISQLEIRVICPGHGPILRDNWKKWVDLSAQYSRKAIDYPDDHVVFIPYVSAYHKTGLIAESIAEGINGENGMKSVICDVETTPIGELDAMMAQCAGVIVGCPTINQNILLPIYKLFAIINPIRDKGKPAAAFGSFGWSGEAVGLIEEHLKNMKLKVVADGAKARFLPNSEETDSLISFGENFARSLREESK